MSKFAVVKIGASQFKVEEGKTYEVPKVSLSGDKLVMKEVLAAGEGETIKFGMPHLDKASVEFEVLETKKGEKVTTRIFKAKSRYRRTRGFRKQLTVLKVKSISF